MSKTQRFRALLEPDGTNLKWVVARVPFDPTLVWKVRQGMRVKGVINGFAFRTSLFGSAAKGHLLLVNKTMQKGAHASAGEMVEITLEPDLEERNAAVPPELTKFAEAGSRARALVSRAKLLLSQEHRRHHQRTEESRGASPARRADD